ncbi:hypothetical protein LCGC14_0467370 [marine sediment metagenome]|uniref:Helix-turn-helix domain-containing protein n=1 Tax=marine sediment metagenome TaxID=412755 RepID=A0A0F9SIK2_9ZZZZ
MSKAQTEKPSKPLKTAGYKIDQELTVALIQGDMPVKDIAERVGCDTSNIYAMISRLKKNGELLKTYRDKEAELIDNVRAGILSNIDHAIINDNLIPEKPSEIQQLSTAFAILTDKSMLVQGKATSNVNVRSYEHSVQELHVMDSNIKKLEQDIASCEEKGID